MPRKKRRTYTVSDFIRKVYEQVVQTEHDGVLDLIVDQWSFVIRSWIGDALSLSSLAGELRERWRIYRKYQAFRGLPAVIDSCPSLPLRAASGQGCCSTGQGLVMERNGTVTRLERHLKKCGRCRVGVEHFLCAELVRIVQAAVRDLRKREVDRPETTHARQILLAYYATRRSGGRWVRRQMHPDWAPFVVPDSRLACYREQWREFRSEIRHLPR